ncbi:MAG: outer membrane beta-barrel protein [Gammaproteobacteria bacterium]|nr:outer membrane beta-barrel protein [Gammaproteobacteria bacterium]
MTREKPTRRAIAAAHRGLLALAAAAALAALRPADAQEAYVLGGGQETPSLKEDTYSYSLEYLHNLGDYAYASYTWLNEGHVTGHHRDGYSPQLWLRLLGGSRRFALSIGAGPYRYYDTTFISKSGAVTDVHDWGGLFSAAAQWYFRAPWVLQLRYNYARTTTSINTDTLQLGVGYQFERWASPGPVPPSSYDLSTPRGEMTLMAGNSIQNNFQSPHGVAYGVEYRERLTPYIDAVGTLLNEGDTGVVKRKGAAGQLALVREFLDHHADVGIAGGFYLAHDDFVSNSAQGIVVAGERTALLGLLSMTVTWRFTRYVHARVYWDRTLTTNGRDTDVVLGGLGFSF